MAPSSQQPPPPHLPGAVLGYFTPTQRRHLPWRILRWVAASLLVIGYLFWLLTPELDPHMGEVRANAKCGMNERQIGQAILLYQNAHDGHFPNALEDLIEIDIGAENFVCPMSND